MENLNMLDVKIHLIWQKGHIEEKGNEFADDLAKLGMMNLYQSRYWWEYEKVFSKKEWINISYGAIKKEQKRNGWYQTLEKWRRMKEKKRKLVEKKEINYDDVL